MEEQFKTLIVLSHYLKPVAAAQDPFRQMILAAEISMIIFIFLQWLRMYNGVLKFRWRMPSTDLNHTPVKGVSSIIPLYERLRIQFSDYEFSQVFFTHPRHVWISRSSL